MGLIISAVIFCVLAGVMHRVFIDKHGNIDEGTLFGYIILAVLSSISWPITLGLVLLALPGYGLFLLGKNG